MKNLKYNLSSKPILNKMNNILAGLIIMLVLSSSMLIAQNNSFEVKSPDGVITVKIQIGAKLLWSVMHDGQQIILPSAIALQLEDGQVLGDNAVVIDTKKEAENKVISAVNYVKAKIPDQYNQLTINFKGDFGVIFRVYNDAAAYRFVTNKVGDIIIKNEEANFNLCLLCGTIGKIKFSIHLLKLFTMRSLFPSSQPIHWHSFRFLWM
jgi:alpha-glucosidase